MKHIKPTANAHEWPRQRVKTLELRNRDLVVKIADWRRDKDEPGYDVEVYVGTVYDWNESQTFRTRDEAVQFACDQIKRLL